MRRIPFKRSQYNARPTVLDEIKAGKVVRTEVVVPSGSDNAAMVYRLESGRRVMVDIFDYVTVWVGKACFDVGGVRGWRIRRALKRIVQ